MKMIVLLLAFCMFTFVFANPDDQTQIEKYGHKIKTYDLNVPGKEPITIIETAPVADEPFGKWEDISTNPNIDRDYVDMKNIMTDIIHDTEGNRPRCYGPSCQEGFENRKQDTFEEYTSNDPDKIKDYREFSPERLQAIKALAAKLQKDKLKADRYSTTDNVESEEDGNGKVYTSWNQLKVKQHKHPYDDKDGWVTLEPVAWSSSKISKWKPNVKKQKPNHWNDDDDRFPYDDRYTSYQGMGNSYNYEQKRPSMPRPTYINNKLQSSSEYEVDPPSKQTWNKPQQYHYSYPSTWSPDEGRRPHRPNCDSEEGYPNDDAVFYGLSDSVVTDTRPSNFPYEYEALHQASLQKRPMRRPTQVVYAGSPELDNDRASRPPYGDGQWVLLSTTKGYRHKKRQRSLNPVADDRLDTPSMTSHQAVALTVLPVDKIHSNMTTSHGGLLEVEKSFQTVEESKQDMDKKNDNGVGSAQTQPTKTKVIKRKIVSNVSPDSSTILAAVGAGMVPATMAMVVPMMLGRRRRRRDLRGIAEHLQLEKLLLKYQ